MENERNKPDCPLIGQDGNVFNLIGMASRTPKATPYQRFLYLPR